jgi:enoyl-CoA hydratase/carnithine racemase
MTDDGYTDIAYEVVDRVATLTFDRPEVMNAMTQGLVAQTIEALDEANTDPEVLVVIITGRGRAFSAGGDVRGLGDRAVGPDGDLPPTAFQRRAWLRRTQRMILAITAVEKPTIAAINGVAAGGGCDIALACDMRIMAEGARIGEIFARIGLFPGTGGTWFLPRLVGVEKALELIWSGDLVDAAEALRIGLVGRVVPADSLEAEASAMAAKFAKGPPLAISLAKSAVYRSLNDDLVAALDYASTAEAITLTSEDHLEGIRAFRDKREPVFKGR